MSESITYALKVIPDDKEIPCHLSELKKDDLFYLVQASKKSELLVATDNAFQSNVNGQTIWSIPHEAHA
ncbi:hypothetical protein D0C16_08725 [Cellvibrio sp. KY-GH-1]|uniref:hypothetical protein n=1 Tax=Cellvibrio sp. KY-GH-1 TaxID=2303332 RepID=UPI001243E6EF|nr:hypothetical protein [Cellvibrio sp. KY-GH-1]QEY16058.1 hypothetical protein D0C16_08725 [Cellvibrio sp. KY-GH-1]